MSKTLPGESAAGAPAGREEVLWPPLQVRRLGTVPYADGLALQEELVGARRAGAVPDTLLLLEHPHVITLGGASDPAHVLAGPERRAALGMELFESGRGGDVTYHGPGQLVGYPILLLEEGRRDLHRYLRDLEGALIDALAAFGVRAERSAGRTGVWTGGSKIAALGVRVSSGWITSHGFALNVSTDLSFFEAIVPCGIAGCTVTSLERELGRRVPTREAEVPVAAALARRLERRLA